jgi:hypothetical protein
MSSGDRQCIQYTVSRALAFGSSNNLTTFPQHRYVLLDTTREIRPFDFRCNLLM